jgi:hypothetical protein
MVVDFRIYVYFGTFLPLYFEGQEGKMDLRVTDKNGC